jgi:hypothetical protein
MSLTVFGQAQLDQIVRDTLKEAPPDHTFAVVGHVDQAGTRWVGGYTRETEHAHWQLAGVYEHDWSGDNKVGGEFIWSGK